VASSEEPSRAPESELDALFAAPLDEFVAVRAEIAKRLADDGRRAEADAVRALRKPPVSVWAVNQLAREREGDITALVEATGRLRGIQAGGRGDFPAASAELQSTLDRLVAASRSVLERAGRPSDEMVRRVAQTLRAAAVADPEGLRRGTLTGEPEAAGFEALLGAVPRGPRAPRPAPVAKLAKAKEGVDAARAAVTERRRAAQEAERRAAAARREWDAAREASERAAAELERAAGELSEAERRVEELRSR